MNVKANATEKNCKDAIAPKLSTVDIGVMGGMFDPIHQGHLSTAVLARETFSLDVVRMLPCGSPVHRNRASASDDDRIAMLGLAIKSHAGLALDARECLSQEPSYTFNTLSAIKTENPGSRLFFILGVDAFNTLPTWHRWRELFAVAHMLVITRPDWDIQMSAELTEENEKRQVRSYEEMQQHNAGKILISALQPQAVSSSEIRALLKADKPLSGLLPEAVLDYIYNHKLYNVTGV